MHPVTIKLENLRFFAVSQTLPTTLFIQACFNTFFQDAPFSNFLQKLWAGLTDFDNSLLVPASQLELIHLFWVNYFWKLATAVAVPCGKWDTSTWWRQWAKRGIENA